MLRVNGAMNSTYAEVTGLGARARRHQPGPDGRVARLYLTTQNDSMNEGKGELVALADGGVQLNASDQFISFNTTSDLANLVIEPNVGGNNDGEVIFGYGFVNLSDRSLKENVRAIPEKSCRRPSTPWNPRFTTASGAARNRSASSPRTCKPAGSWARRCARQRIWTGGS